MGCHNTFFELGSGQIKNKLFYGLLANFSRKTFVPGTAYRGFALSSARNNSKAMSTPVSSSIKSAPSSFEYQDFN